MGRVVTFTGEELLPSGGKSRYLHGGRVVTLGGKSCYFQWGRVVSQGEKSCYPQGEELLCSGGRSFHPQGKSCYPQGEELLPSGGRVYLTLTFFSFLISLWDWNCSCRIFTRCDANCCRSSRIYHVKCVRAHIF